MIALASVQLLDIGGTINAISTVPGIHVYPSSSVNEILIRSGATISGGYAIQNQATIQQIINYGNLTATAVLSPQMAEIANGGTITRFHNAQGASTAVSINGRLPAEYYVIIRGANDFGRLRGISGVAAPTGVMRFDVSQYSTAIAGGTYTAVLQNIAASQLDPTSLSGIAGGLAWQLVDPDQDNSWDLLVVSSAPPAPPAPPGPDAANTLLGLQSNAYAVRSVLSQRAAATTFALDYDCSVFDQHGLCVSVGARNTQMGSNYSDSGETAGLLTAAYRVTQELRLGGFIDQNLVSQSPVGVDPKNTQPMLGAFAVYQENPDFSGLTIRAALAYQEGDLRITRPEITDTEAGTGRTRTTAVAFGGEIAYGVPLDETWIAQPYAGLRRSDSQRRGYTETTSDSVEFPVTYNRFGQQVTSATAGLRLRGAITPEFSLTFGAGMEHDLDSKMDRYAGTSAISGLETFSINASQQQNETRAVGSAGMRHMVASNQALGFDASMRQLPYGNDPSVTTMVRYSIGF